MDWMDQNAISKTQKPINSTNGTNLNYKTNPTKQNTPKHGHPTWYFGTYLLKQGSVRTIILHLIWITIVQPEYKKYNKVEV